MAGGIIKSIFFLPFLVTFTLAITSTNYKNIKCYVCQWSNKPGYSSVFSQDCTDKAIKNNPEKYVQTCLDSQGCKVTNLYEGSEENLISVVRECATNVQNSFLDFLYCRGNGCSTNEDGVGEAITGPKAACAQLASTTDKATVDSLTATPCATADTATEQQYCMRRTTWIDVVSSGSFGSAPGPEYYHTCIKVNINTWKDKYYRMKTKKCVNDLCNAGIAAPNVTTMGDDSPSPVSTSMMMNSSVAFTLIMVLSTLLVLG